MSWVRTLLRMEKKTRGEGGTLIKPRLQPISMKPAPEQPRPISDRCKKLVE